MVIHWTTFPTWTLVRAATYREQWKPVLPQAALLTIFIYILFDQLLSIPWPQTLLGQLIPALRFIPSV